MNFLKNHKMLRSIGGFFAGIVVTSAMAVGVSLAFLKVDIVPAVILIGVTTACFSAFGVWLGNIFGCRFKSKAEFAGGLILVIIGVKILLEHTL